MNNILETIDNGVKAGTISNAYLLQIIELAGSYLNLQTRTDYAKQNGISYNGAKKHRQNVKLFGVNFIIDNE